MRLFEGTQWDVPPVCDRCGRAEEDCGCPPQPAPVIPPEQQSPRVAIEKRKRGKSVTVIRDLADQSEPLAALLTQLKGALGSGGTIKEGTIEIQGDHDQRVRELLTQLGYRMGKGK